MGNKLNLRPFCPVIMTGGDGLWSREKREVRCIEATLAGVSKGAR